MSKADELLLRLGEEVANGDAIGAGNLKRLAADAIHALRASEAEVRRLRERCEALEAAISDDWVDAGDLAEYIEMYGHVRLTRVSVPRLRRLAALLSPPSTEAPK